MIGDLWPLCVQSIENPTILVAALEEWFTVEDPTILVAALEEWFAVEDPTILVAALEEWFAVEDPTILVATLEEWLSYYLSSNVGGMVRCRRQWKCAIDDIEMALKEQEVEAQQVNDDYDEELIPLSCKNIPN